MDPVWLSKKADTLLLLNLLGTVMIIGVWAVLAVFENLILKSHDKRKRKQPDDQRVVCGH